MMTLYKIPNWLTNNPSKFEIDRSFLACFKQQSKLSVTGAQNAADLHLTATTSYPCVFMGVDRYICARFAKLPGSTNNLKNKGNILLDLNSMGRFNRPKLK